jgi:serine/threonine protein kinase
MDFESLFGDLFELERVVASSPERVLYLVRDRVLKRRVALRVQTGAAGRDWFLRESEVLALLDHPSIRHVYAAGVRKALAFRVGNWIEGESLEEAVARGPRPIPLVLTLARDLLSALDHAHVRGVVMRRVRPTTLMLDASGRAVITDLRHANRVLDLVPPEARADDDPFLAPEIRGGEPGDPSADIYTAGAVLYYALTGAAPGERVAPVRQLRAQCPAVVERIVLRALRSRPRERYLTAAEMLADLAADTGEFNEPGAGPPSLILPSSPLWERRLRRALGDDYELLSEIGAGSFGRVYRVRDLRLEREVALKVLDPELTQDPAIAEAFEKEARIAASLTHPNIVGIFDIGGRLGLLWYVMALVKGESVWQRVKRLGRASVADTVDLLDETLAALEHAHRRRLVHRDIKPENLLLDGEGHVHVTDFGLALALPRGRIFGGATSRSGTPQFAAPEQLVGGQVDGRTDLYSLGAVGYYCLLGRPPFADRTLDSILKGRLSSTPPPLAPDRDDVPEALEAALRKACAFDPDDRFAEAPQFREAIEAAGFVTGERRIEQRSGPALVRALKRALGRSGG